MYNFVTGKAVDRKITSSKTDNKLFKCKLSCCQSCSYCPRALTKERDKSWGGRLLSDIKEIKICQRCFLCHSITLCKTCNKCPKCCHKSACRGQTSELLENVVGSGCRSENSSNPERGLHPPLSDPAKAYKVSHSHKLLCKPPQEQLPAGGIASAYRQKCSRVGKKQNIPEFLQPVVFSPKTKQQMETYTRPEQSEPFSQGREIKNGNTGNHQNISPTRGVGHLCRLQRCLLPHTDTGTIQEISQISYPGSDLPIQSTALWSVHSTHGVHCTRKGGETDGHIQGYKNPPIPRRLVGQSQIPPNLSPAYPDSGQKVPGFRLAGECREIRTGGQTGFRLCRLPV